MPKEPPPCSLFGRKQVFRCFPGSCRLPPSQFLRKQPLTLLFSQPLSNPAPEQDSPRTAGPGVPPGLSSTLHGLFHLTVRNPQADNPQVRSQHTLLCPMGHPHGAVTLELATHSPLLAPREGHRDAVLPPVLVSAVRHPGHAPLQDISTDTKLLEGSLTAQPYPGTHNPIWKPTAQQFAFHTHRSSFSQSLISSVIRETCTLVTGLAQGTLLTLQGR